MVCGGFNHYYTGGDDVSCPFVDIGSSSGGVSGHGSASKSEGSGRVTNRGQASSRRKQRVMHAEVRIPQGDTQGTTNPPTLPCTHALSHTPGARLGPIERPGARSARLRGLLPLTDRCPWITPLLTTFALTTTGLYRRTAAVGALLRVISGPGDGVVPWKRSIVFLRDNKPRCSGVGLSPMQQSTSWLIFSFAPLHLPPLSRLVWFAPTLQTQPHTPTQHLECLVYTILPPTASRAPAPCMRGPWNLNTQQARGVTGADPRSNLSSCTRLCGVVRRPELLAQCHSLNLAWRSAFRRMQTPTSVFRSA